jgi:hypothetical protein
MWMITKSLAPGVKHRKEADLGAQVLGVSRDGAQRLSGSPEQNVVDDLLVLRATAAMGCGTVKTT